MYPQRKCGRYAPALTVHQAWPKDLDALHEELCRLNQQIEEAEH
jgi:hypothetical protein